MTSRVFHTSQEYPDSEELLDKGMAPGVFYEYVSSTYAGMHLPLMRLARVVLLERYRGRGGEAPVSDAEIEGVLTAPHTNLGGFGDDVVVIGVTPGHWWVIHLDCDVSDCRIGRVSRVDYPTMDAVSAWVDVYINPPPPSDDWKVRAEIPTNRVRGWVTF